MDCVKSNPASSRFLLKIVSETKSLIASAFR